MSRSPGTPIGLIAGGGGLPLLVARGMRAANHRVCCVAIRDRHHADLPALCDEFATAGMVRLGRWIRLLRRWGVRDAVMVGNVAKERMHEPGRLLRQIPDLRTLVLWYRRLRHDHRNAAVLAAVAEELAVNEITLIDSTTHIPEHLATPGVMGCISPLPSQRADIDFGWPLLERMVELDVGQAIVVRDRDVVAVEALEGTDRMIERAGTLCRAGGWTLLKTARAEHDRRADVPTIGTGTIERLAEAGGGCIGLGAGRTILVDRPAVVETADRLGIALVGVNDRGVEGEPDTP